MAHTGQYLAPRDSLAVRLIDDETSRPELLAGKGAAEERIISAEGDSQSGWWARTLSRQSGSAPRVGPMTINLAMPPDPLQMGQLGERLRAACHRLRC